MFYEPGKTDPKADLGLPFNPFKALIQPRPIGWISTLSGDGKANLAPYSFFNGLGDNPPMVMFASNNSPHSVANARATGEFVVNMVVEALKDQMNITSGSEDVDEFEAAGLTKVPCHVVKAPRVGESPASMECRVIQSIDLPGPDNKLTIGQVVGIHIDNAVFEDGMVRKILPLARLGYFDYTVVREVFSLQRPKSAQSPV